MVQTVLLVILIYATVVIGVYRRLIPSMSPAIARLPLVSDFAASACVHRSFASPAVLDICLLAVSSRQGTEYSQPAFVDAIGARQRRCVGNCLDPLVQIYRAAALLFCARARLPLARSRRVLRGDEIRPGRVDQGNRLEHGILPYGHIDRSAHGLCCAEIEPASAALAHRLSRWLGDCRRRRAVH